LIAGGLLAGIINTLAGNGSTITLFLLMTFGLPATVANGTNRVGILLQSIVAVKTFQRSERFLPLLKESWFAITLAVLSGIGGAVFASEMDTTLLKKVIGILMIVMFFIILIKPSRWLRETDTTRNRNTLLSALFFIGIGFYAGFIQMGMGLFFLAIMVLGAKYSLVDANILKLVVTLFVTIPAFLVYWYQGQIHWEYGIILSIGQSAGAYIAARFAVNNPKANLWIHRLLMIMVVVAIINLLELDKWFRLIFNF
jgi:uncharacterized membrane protein YfcA